jgi:uncharacterized protein (UPF0261 family)
VVGTLDTRGDEIGYLRDLITGAGRAAIVIDAGVLGTPQVRADITREQVAAAGGADLAVLRRAARDGADRALATEAMSRGGRRLVADLAAAGTIAAIIGLGGSTGTALCSSIMAGLPAGFPGLLLTTVPALARTGDAAIAVLESPVDLIGLNPIVSHALAQAAHAVLGLADAPPVIRTGRPLVGITALGVTTPAAQHVLAALAGLGADGVVFHWRTGRLNQLIEDGTIDAVIDLTAYEIMTLLDGPGDAPGDGAAAGRLAAARRRDVPWVTAPGGLDMHIIVTPDGADGIPARLRGRPWSRHGPQIVLVRTDRADLTRAAQFLAGQLRGTRRSAVLVPGRGFSDADQPGRPLYAPGADHEFTGALRAGLAGTVSVTEVDCHINDPEFAAALVREYQRLSAS